MFPNFALTCYLSVPSLLDHHSQSPSFQTILWLRTPTTRRELARVLKAMTSISLTWTTSIWWLWILRILHYQTDVPQHLLVKFQVIFGTTDLDIYLIKSLICWNTNWFVIFLDGMIILLAHWPNNEDYHLFLIVIHLNSYLIWFIVRYGYVHADHRCFFNHSGWLH